MRGHAHDASTNRAEVQVTTEHGGIGIQSALKIKVSLEEAPEVWLKQVTFAD